MDASKAGDVTDDGVMEDGVYRWAYVQPYQRVFLTHTDLAAVLRAAADEVERQQRIPHEVVYSFEPRSDDVDYYPDDEDKHSILLNYIHVE